MRGRPHADDLADVAFQAKLRARGRANIFFVRTSQETSLSPLDACAVASAAHHNPNSAVMVVSQSLSCAAAYAVAPSVRVVRFTYAGAFSNHTRLASWYRSGTWRGAYDKNNLGNALRLALLSTYGGAYFDTDMLSLARTDDLPAFIAVEREGTLNNAALAFPAGSAFLELAIYRFVREFRKVWGWNGPALMTRTWRVDGGEESAAGAARAAASAPLHEVVDIRPQHEFYAIPFSAADAFFSSTASGSGSRWLAVLEKADRAPRMVHVWNKRNKALLSKLKSRCGGSVDPVDAASAADDGAAGPAGGGGSAEEDAEAAGDGSSAAAAGRSEGENGGNETADATQQRGLLPEANGSDNSISDAAADGAPRAVDSAADGGAAAVATSAMPRGDAESSLVGRGSGDAGGASARLLQATATAAATAMRSATASTLPCGARLVERVMLTACPAYVATAMPALAASISSALGASPPLRIQPPQPHAELLKPWLEWPVNDSATPSATSAPARGGRGGARPARAGSGRRASAARGGGTVDAAPYALVVLGRRSAAVDVESGGASNASEVTARVPTPTLTETVRVDCSSPSGKSLPLLCGAAMPLPFHSHKTHAWTVSMWLRAPVNASSSSLAMPEVEAIPHEGNGNDVQGECEAGAVFGCADAECNAVTPPGDPRPVEARAGPTASAPPQHVGALVARFAPGGRLSLRFPYGSAALTLRAPLASSSWRHIAITYIARYTARREAGSSWASGDVTVYVDGLFAMTRHMSLSPVNATSQPQVLLFDGTLLRSASSGLIPARVEIDTVSIVASHLSDEAVLLHRSAEVQKAATTWASAACRGRR